MTKRTIPAPTFKGKLSPGHVGDQFIRVPVSDVHVLENFNLRVRGTPEYDDAIEEFTRSIQANGFYDDKPLAGYLNDKGEVIVIDGHRRLEAIQRLNNASLDGPVVETVPVVLKPETSSIADLHIAMIQSASGKELTMFEKGIGVRRLLADGMEKHEIADRLGVSEKTIENYLTVASVPAKARDLLLDNKVTSTQVLRTKGDADKLQKMVDTAAAKGRMRARPSDAVQERIEASVDAIQAAASPAAGDVAQALTFTVDITKDAEMGAMLRQVAKEIRVRVPHDPGDTDAAHAAGTISVTITLPVEAKPKPRRRKAAPAVEDAAPVDQGEPDLLSHALANEL